MKRKYRFSYGKGNLKMDNVVPVTQSITMQLDELTVAVRQLENEVKNLGDRIKRLATKNCSENKRPEKG